MTDINQNNQAFDIRVYLIKNISDGGLIAVHNAILKGKEKDAGDNERDWDDWEKQAGAEIKERGLTQD